MIAPLIKLSSYIFSKFRIFGSAAPNKQVISALLEIAYLASLRTEEGRFVGGSITYANPQKPDVCPPITIRADYPCFTAFRVQRKLTVDNLLKLSRAINNWTGSIVVYGTNKSNLIIWGVVDQLSQQNTSMVHENSSGFSSPGIMRINIDGIAALTVYHEDVFLGSLRQDRIITKEQEAFQSDFLARHIIPALSQRASQISLVLDRPSDSDQIGWHLYKEWGHAISRLCIGIRRIGTGGSLLITPTPINNMLNISYDFPYKRLGDSMTLNLLDQLFHRKQVRGYIDWTIKHKSAPISQSMYRKIRFADTDATDRVDELTGSIKLVTSLATVDGLVLLKPSLEVTGFGVKIVSDSPIRKIYDAASYTRTGRFNKELDISNFGTRHSSMIRYCQTDKNAVGVVVSQDGQVRVVMTLGKSLIMWENVKLLDHKRNLSAHRKDELRSSEHRERLRHTTKYGYTDTPKTIKALLRFRPKKNRNKKSN